MMQDLSFVHKYFMAEKQAGLLFIVLGVAAVVLGMVFLLFVKTNPSFFKGAAIPLLAIGLLQLVIGYSIYHRSDKQRMDVAYQMGMEPVAYIKQTEQPRMEKAVGGIRIFTYAELALLLAAVVLLVLYRADADKRFWYGLAVTLLIQSAVCLSADWMAWKRAATYTSGMQALLPPGK